MIAEELQLIFRDCLDDSFDKGLLRFASQGFVGIKVDLQPWPFIARRTAGDGGRDCELRLTPPSLGPHNPVFKCLDGQHAFLGQVGNVLELEQALDHAAGLA